MTYELNDDILYKKYDTLIALKKDTYESLLRQCINQIKLTAETGELRCIYTIPRFAIGKSFPSINIESCANYMMNKLYESNKNIKTNFIEPNMIFIDWSKD